MPLAYAGGFLSSLREHKMPEGREFCLQAGVSVLRHLKVLENIMSEIVEVEVKLNCYLGAQIRAEVGHLKDDPDFKVIREIGIYDRYDREKVLTREEDYIKNIIRKNLAENLPYIRYYIARDEKVPRLEKQKFITLSRLYSLLSCKPKTPDLPWE